MSLIASHYGLSFEAGYLSESIIRHAFEYSLWVCMSMTFSLRLSSAILAHVVKCSFVI